MSFSPDIAAHAGEGHRVMGELRAVLRELGVETTGLGEIARAEWTPGSYEPMSYRFWAPEGTGMIAIEGLLTDLGAEPSEDCRRALNLLNVELESLRYYAAGTCIYVRADLLPYTNKSKWINPRELKLALTNVCAQSAQFKDAIEDVQRGRNWSAIKDVIKAFR